MINAELKQITELMNNNNLEIGSGIYEFRRTIETLFVLRVVSLEGATFKITFKNINVAIF